MECQMHCKLPLFSRYTHICEYERTSRGRCLCASPGSPRGFLLVGTAVQWRWNSPPGNLAGTRTSAVPQVLCASSLAWARAWRPGIQPDTASGTHVPPGPAPPCSPCLDKQSRFYFEMFFPPHNNTDWHQKFIFLNSNVANNCSTLAWH